MSINKSKLITEGDCPFCGTTFIFDDKDRDKGENTCTDCGKTYKLMESKNIKFGNIIIKPISKVLESDCPFCGTRFKFDDKDREKGENTCSNCRKTYKLEDSKYIEYTDSTKNFEVAEKPLETKKKQKVPTCIVLLIIAIAFPLILSICSAIANIGNNSSSTKITNTPIATYTPTPTKTPEEIARLKAEADAKAEADRLAEVERQKQEAIRLANEESTFKANSPSISYALLEKGSTPYIGDKVYYKGKVDQVGTEYSTEWYRISITNEGYGYYTDTLWVTYPGTTNIVKDDIVQFWGNITSQHCYTSTANWEICIPAVNAKYINKSK